MYVRYVCQVSSLVKTRESSRVKCRPSVDPTLDGLNRCEIYQCVERIDNQRESKAPLYKYVAPSIFSNIKILENVAPLYEKIDNLKKKQIDIYER